MSMKGLKNQVIKEPNSDYDLVEILLGSQKEILLKGFLQKRWLKISHPRDLRSCKRDKKEQKVSLNTLSGYTLEHSVLLPQNLDKERERIELRMGNEDDSLLVKKSTLEILLWHH